MHSQIYKRVKRVAAIATTELARASENSAVQFVLKRNNLLNFDEKMLDFYIYKYFLMKEKSSARYDYQVFITQCKLRDSAWTRSKEGLRMNSDVMNEIGF